MGLKSHHNYHLYFWKFSKKSSNQFLLILKVHEVCSHGMFLFCISVCFCKALVFDGIYCGFQCLMDMCFRFANFLTLCLLSRHSLSNHFLLQLFVILCLYFIFLIFKDFFAACRMSWIPEANWFIPCFEMGLLELISWFSFIWDSGDCSFCLKIIAIPDEL